MLRNGRLGAPQYACMWDTWLGGHRSFILQKGGLGGNKSVQQECMWDTWLGGHRSFILRKGVLGGNKSVQQDESEKESDVIISIMTVLWMTSICATP
eukprot:1160776-Pelagomonas_calceolata.AAC.1